MRCLLTLLLIGALSPLFAAAELRDGRPRFLSGPDPGPPLQIVERHLAREHLALGLEASDIAGVRLSDQHRSARTGMTHVYLQQQFANLDVAGAVLSAGVTHDGRLLAFGSRFEPGLAHRARGWPALEPTDAVARAGEALDLTASGPISLLEAPSGVDRSARLAAPGLSEDLVPVRLVWVPVEDGAANGEPVLRLAWEVVLREPSGQHWWCAFVDAVTGDLLKAHDWVDSDSYLVFPFPGESPDSGPASVEVDPADPVASPFGWHDTNEVPGAEFTDTRGNNVNAQDDTNGNNGTGSRPSGGASLVFNEPIDLTQPPATYLDGSIVNVFYWTNILHDLFAGYGFDEAAGNFQVRNYGGSPGGSDELFADVQDGSGLNNANFASPRDGLSPRLQLFIWNERTGPTVVIEAPAAIQGPLPTGFAEFGPPVDSSGTFGSVVLALDPADANGPTTTDACSPLTNAAQVAGNIALVDRGVCTFVTKVGIAQAAGAIGVIVANNAGNDLVTMSGTDPTIVIPSLFIGQDDGSSIKAQLGVGVDARLIDLPDRDSALDAGLIAHEYGHGVSSRLTGGRLNPNCLTSSQPDGMGEGWSDFFALALTPKIGDTGPDPRGIATYLLAEPRNGAGIRNFRYSTDLNVNPLSYGDITTLNQPHGVGEVWAAALWDMYWNLVTVHGFDPDVRAGSGGNNLAIQLVTDGLKAQPCNPSFLDGRDAILAADTNLTGGRNACLIWDAFARRGMGSSATDGGSPNSLNPNEDFTVPPLTCTPTDTDADGIPDDGDFSGVAGDAVCAPGATLWCDDNCPFTANPGQEDTGSLNSTTPDGIGNACQCGDTNSNGVVNLADAGRYNVWLATNGASPPNFALDRCDVGGTPACTLGDVGRINLAIAGGVTLKQQCPAATSD